jgi:hypothetical protein
VVTTFCLPSTKIVCLGGGLALTIVLESVGSTQRC